MAKNEMVQVENKLSKLLANNAIKALAQNLKLTEKQIEKANATALALQSNDNLRNCDQFSLLQYCYSIARFNFTREDAVYPVPYNGKVQAQIGFQGYRELALRNGKYSKIEATEVRECDTITTTDEGEPDVHFNGMYIERKKSKIIGYFAYAKDTNGNFVKRIFWTVEECMKHGKKYSKAYNSIWGDPDKFPAMCKKTVIKQLCKSLDYSPLVETALKEDQIVYGSVGQANTYADNPKNVETFDFSNEETKSTTTNSILPPAEEPEEEPAKEEPKKEAKVETKPTPKQVAKKEAVPAKTENTAQDDDFYDQFDDIIGA